MVGLLLLFGSQLDILKRFYRVFAILLIASIVEIFRNASHYFADAEMSNKEVASILYIDPVSINIQYMTAVQAGIIISILSIFSILLFMIVRSYKR